MRTAPTNRLGCQVFANERWHFELATTAGGRCPPMLPDNSYRN